MAWKRIVRRVLGVKGLIVEDVKHEDPEGFGGAFERAHGIITIYVRPSKGMQYRCPICGRKCKFYDNGRGRRTWRACD